MAPGSAVLIDRDGVIVRHRHDYVKSLDEMEVLPGAIDALVRLSRSGHRVLVITNQSAIGRGLTTRAEVDLMHERLSAEVRERGGTIDGFLVCPHTPEDRCDCRKPAPGLLYRARDEYGVELGSAVVIGDAPTDMEAARTAGCAGILVLSGLTGKDDRSVGGVTARDLDHAAELILTSR